MIVSVRIEREFVSGLTSLVKPKYAGVEVGAETGSVVGELGVGWGWRFLRIECPFLFSFYSSGIFLMFLLLLFSSGMHTYIYYTFNCVAG